jgi:hypothetical protein
MSDITTRTEEGAREDAIALLDKFNKLTMEDAIRAAVSAEMRFRAAEARAATAEAEVERLKQAVDALEVKLSWSEARTNIVFEHKNWCREKQLAAEATASALRDRVAVLEEALEGWKRVAVIAAIPLEAMRAAGSYRALAASTQDCVDDAVITIRMAVCGHGLPPKGNIDAGLEPARAALKGGVHD